MSDTREKCGKPRNDVKHVKYGADLDNPIKHRFQPVPSAEASWMQGVDCPWCEDGTPHVHDIPGGAPPLSTDKTDAREQRQDEQRQKSADAPCKTEGELDDPETWRGIGEASEQEPPAIEGCNHLRECGFCLAERDMFAKDYVARQTAALRNDTEANRPASVSEGIWEFYGQHYKSFNDGSIDADEMCEFASAYAAQQTATIRRVLNNTEAKRARLRAQLIEARGEVYHLREQLEQAKVDAVPQLT